MLPVAQNFIGCVFTGLQISACMATGYAVSFTINKIAHHCFGLQHDSKIMNCVSVLAFGAGAVASIYVIPGRMIETTIISIGTVCYKNQALAVGAWVLYLAVLKQNYCSRLQAHLFPEDSTQRKFFVKFINPAVQILPPFFIVSVAAGVMFPLQRIFMIALLGVGASFIGSINGYPNSNKPLIFAPGQQS